VPHTPQPLDGGIGRGAGSVVQLSSQMGLGDSRVIGNAVGGETTGVAGLAVSLVLA